MRFSKRAVQLSRSLVMSCLLVAAFARCAHAGSGKTGAPGYLGIMFHDVSESEVSTLHLKNRHGAEIVTVDHDGPAGKAGLREHDVVLGLNGSQVDGEDQLRKMLHEIPPGRTVLLSICRDGSERMITATLATRADVEKQAMEGRWTVPSPPLLAAEEPASVDPPAPPSPRGGFAHSFMPGHLLPTSPAYTGAAVDAMGSQLAEFFGVGDGKGLLVHAVDDNSPAAAAGLRAGDVVTRMDGARVATEKDWARALRDSKGRAVRLTVIRERREQLLTMMPEAKRRSAVDQPTQWRELPVAEPPPLVM